MKSNHLLIRLAMLTLLLAGWPSVMTATTADERPLPLYGDDEDYSFYFTDLSFESGELHPYWSYSGNGQAFVVDGGGTVGSDGAYVFSLTGGTGHHELGQTVIGLPRGYYTVAAKVASYGDAVTLSVATSEESIFNITPSTTVNPQNPDSLVTVIVRNVMVSEDGWLDFSIGADGGFKADAIQVVWHHDDPSVSLEEVESLLQSIPTGKMSNEAKQMLEESEALLRSNPKYNNFMGMMGAVSWANRSIEGYAHLKQALDHLLDLKSTTNVVNTDGYLDLLIYSTLEEYENGTVSDDYAASFHDPFELTSYQQEGNATRFLISAWGENDWNRFHVNTWATANELQGTDFGVPFLEYDAGRGHVPDTVLTARVPGLAPGIYKVSMDMLLKSYSLPQGLSVGVGTGEDTPVFSTNVGNGWYTYPMTAYGQVGTDGVLEVRVKVSCTNVLRLAFKNVMYERVNLDYSSLHAALMRAKLLNAAVPNGVEPLNFYLPPMQALFDDATSQSELNDAVPELQNALTNAEHMIRARKALMGEIKKARALSRYLDDASALSQALASAEAAALNPDLNTYEVYDRIYLLQSFFSDWEEVEIQNGGFDEAPNLYRGLNPWTPSPIIPSTRVCDGYWWEAAAYQASAACGVTAEYGTSCAQNLAANGLNAPREDMYGNADGAAIFTSVGEGDWVAYSQQTYLVDRGKYVFYVECLEPVETDYYNTLFCGLTSQDGDPFQDLDNVSMFADANHVYADCYPGYIPTGEWAPVTCSFRWNGEGRDLRLSVGLDGGILGMVHDARMWFDNVKLYWIKPDTILLDENVGYTGFYTHGCPISIKISLEPEQWNTIILPLELHEELLSELFGEGTQLARFDGGYIRNNECVANFKLLGDDDYAGANIPYLIKPMRVSPDNTYFIEKDKAGIYYMATEIDYGNFCNFVGTYRPDENIQAGDYYLSGQSFERAYPQTSPIKAFHAYLTTRDPSENSNDDDVQIKSVRVFIDGVEVMAPTGIQAPATGTRGIGSTFFNLQGQPVSQPRRGIYVRDGKKVYVP